ncbi:MAG TPA: SDR family oxidoreductase [Phycisphaerae bacterium]|nr:SDR family oxidoreductase [Phycisphaerae bacterium]HRY68363.1 SDR family oxidoreductase [Phycisphaerae bacterium]
MRAEHPRTTLMTGSTGFLGHYVLRDLLTRGHRVVAVIRAPLADSSGRLLALLAEVGLDAGPLIEQNRLVLVEGSLPDRLPGPSWGPTDDILHNAASLQLFSNGNGDPHKTNVGGAEAIVRWAEDHGVRRIHTVSTAYTCGWNTGVILEQFHEPEPEFQTDYERTKWQAEILFKQWGEQNGRTLTVFRPSFLVGDSETGYTTQFGGFYQFARLVGVLKQRYFNPNNGARTYIPLRVPGKPDDVQNLITVDFVSRIIAEVILAPQYHGRIYHLTNPEPPTNDFMKRCYEDYYGLYGGYFADPNEVVGKCTQAESMLWDQYHLLTPRVVHTPHFDTTNTRRIMTERGIELLPLTRERVLMLFDWAAGKGWGRAAGNGKSKSVSLV